MQDRRPINSQDVKVQEGFFNSYIKKMSDKTLDIPEYSILHIQKLL